jgi:micrococcal nuclease
MSRFFPSVVLACSIAILILAAGCTVQIDDGTRAGTRSGQFTPGIAYSARAIHVTDGDTLRVMFPDSSQETIRILGVDTPEISPGGNDPGSFEGVSDPHFLVSWAEEAASTLRREVEGREVMVTTDRAAGERDRYGRLLAYLSTSDGTDIGEVLLSRGLARVYTAESFARKDAYLGMQQTAMQKRIGIWSGMTPALPGSDGVFLAGVHYDAAGDDRANLNDEYITIRNGGATPVDLTGWQILDDGTVAFVFPGMTLPPGVQVIVHSGSGSPEGKELFIGSGVPILNNDAGTLILRDQDGAERSRFSWD